MRPIERSILRAILLGITLLCPPSCLRGQETESPKSIDQPFVRIFASLERIKELAGEETFLPMARRDFEGIVASLNKSLPAQVQRNVVIDRATYSARLVNQDLVDGRGTFSISSAVDVETEVDLGKFNLPIHLARWRKTNRAASIGLSNTGDTVLLVPRSDECDFRWSLRGLRSSRTVRFTFDLCEVIQHEFSITTPTNVKLVADGGTITLASNGDVREWDVRISGARRITLLAVPEADVPQARTAFARQNTVYKATDTGLETVSTIDLDVLSRATTKLVCDLSAGLQPRSISVDSSEVDWEIREIQPDGRLTISIDLPDSKADPETAGAELTTSRTLRINGMADIVAEKNVTLPRIMVRSCEWMQEAAFVQLAESVVVKSLVLSDCKQTEYSTSAASRAYRFDYSSVDGAIDIKFGKADDETSIVAGTGIHFMDSHVSAISVAEITTANGAVFAVVANVQPGWTIETVEITATEGQASNLVDRWDEIGSDETNNRQLIVRLRRPISSVRRVRLTVTSTRVLASDIPHAAEQLEPLRFVRSDESSRYLAVQNSESHRIIWEDGQNAEWTDVSDVPTELRGPLAVRDADTILRFQNEDSGATFRLEDSGASFNTDVEIASYVADGLAHETVRIRVSPTSGFVRSLTVQASNQAEFHWTLNRTNQALIVEDQPAKPDLSRSLLRLHSAMDQQFDLVGTRTVTFDEQYVLHGMQIEQATVQSGSAVVSASLDSHVDLAPLNGVEPSPHERPQSSDVPGAQHRFSVARQMFAISQPLIDVRVSDQRSSRHTTVWLLQPTTIVDPLRQHRHVVTMFIENHGDNSLPVFVPTNCIVSNIFVDGRNVDSASSEPGAFLVPLPTGNRFPVVQLEMSERQDSSVVAKRLGQRVTCPRVKIEVPVFERRWMVWTPPGAMPTLAEHWNSALTSSDVMSRFFGPFARKSGIRPFDFFSDQSWLSIFRRKDHRGALRSAQLWSDHLKPSQPEPSRLWKDVIGAFDDANRIAKSSSLIVPLLDSKRLAERGIRPSTPIVKNRDQDGHPKLLTEFDLVIVATRTHVYLTTAEALGMLTIPYEWTEIPNVVRIREGILSGDTANEQIQNQLGSFMTVSGWLSDSQTIQWKLGIPDDLLMVASGWRLTSVPSNVETPTLLYIDRNFVTRVSVVCFLMATCFSWIASRYGAHWSIASILVTAAACVVLPSTLAASGSMVFWGTIVGCLLHWSKRALAEYNNKRTPHSRAEATTIGLSKPVVMTIVALAFVLAPADSNAVEIAGADLERPTEIVYVPIDDEGNPDQKNLNVYLSRDFYDELLSFQVRSSGLAAKWIVDSIRYHASIDRAFNAEEIAVFAVFQIQTLDADVRVRLAFPPEALRMLERDAVLDGQPIRLQNTSNADSIELLFDDVDRHELELTFQAPVRSEGDQNSIVLPVRPALDAQVRISSFADVRTIAVASVGTQEQDTERGELRADLGPAQVLDVSWQVDRTADRVTDATATQVGWTHVTSDNTTHDLKLLIDYPTGQISPVKVVADSRLRPNENGALPVSFDELDGNRIRYHFLPVLQSESKAIVHAQFDLVGSSCIGRIRFPSVEVENIDVTQRMLAASFGPSLVGIPWRTSGLTSVPLSEFANAWGADNESPGHAYIVNRPDHTCIFSCDSLEEEAEVSLSTDFLVGTRRTKVFLVATVNSRSNSLYQARLRIPQDVIIKTVTMVQGQIRHPVDWSRSDESVVTFFLPGNANGPVSIELTGSVANENGQFVAPSFSPIDMRSKDNRVFLFRQPNLHVDELEADGYTNIPIDQSVSRSAEFAVAIPHSAKIKDKENAKLVARIQPVSSNLELESVLVFDPMQDRCAYDLKCRITNAADQCDVIRLQVPNSWGVPELANATGTVRKLPSPQSRFQIVVVQPRQPITKGSVIQLTGVVDEDLPVKLDSYIGVTGGKIGRQLVAVRDAEDVFWEPFGLDAFESEIPPFAANENELSFLRVSNTNAFVQRRQRVEGNDSTAINSVRHAVFIDERNTQIVTDMVVIAQGSGELSLEVPSPAAIQQALVNGVPLQIDVDARDRVLLPLARAAEPQELRLVWSTDQFDLISGTRQELDFPQIRQKVSNAEEADQIVLSGETIWQFQMPEDAVGIEFFVGDRKLEADFSWLSPIVSIPSPDEDKQQLAAFRIGRVGDATTTRLRFTRSSHLPVYMRLATALMALVGGAFVVTTRFKPFSVAEADLWIYTGSVLCGLAWWLFLQPSIVGWIIIAGVLFIAWLARW